MKEKKSLLESYDDVLSDNTHIDYCEQCESCIHWGNNKDDPFSNRYDKTNCDMFPYPDYMKPMSVINNLTECEFYEEE